jgi:hypothetical protein
MIKIHSVVFYVGYLKTLSVSRVSSLGYWYDK